ncbi:MAG: oligosaccharide flippase family protein [Candidatus Sericytochromatia bacterium]
MSKLQSLSATRLSLLVTQTFFRQILTMGLDIFSAILMARALGVTGNGLYTMSTFFTSLLMIVLNAGIPAANVFFIGRGEISLRRALQHTLRLSSGVFTLGLTSYLILQALGWEHFFPGVSPLYLWIAFWLFPVSLFQSYLNSFLQALHAFSEFNLAFIITSVLRLLGILCWVLPFQKNVQGFLLNFVWASLGGLVLTGLLLFKVSRSSNQPLSSAVQQVNLKTFLSFGLKNHAGTIMAFLNDKLDVYMLNLLIGVSSVGMYTIAALATRSLWVISDAFRTILDPLIVSLHTDEALRLRITPLVAKVVVVLSTISALIFLIMLRPLISLTFGAEYLPAIPCIALLLPGVIAGNASRIFASDIYARGYPGRNAQLTFWMVGLNLCGNAVLIPAFGIHGAAGATSAALLITTCMRIRLYCQLSQQQVRQVLLINQQDLQMLKRLGFKLQQRLQGIFPEGRV